MDTSRKKAQINKLRLHFLAQGGEKEETKLKVNRKNEITNIRVKHNERASRNHRKY